VEFQAEEAAMKLFYGFVVCFLANAIFAGPIITGNSMVESGKVIPKPTTVAKEKFLQRREYIQNPGFETGSLYPWFTNNWIVDTINPHNGRFCASDVGDYWIRQNITPIPAIAIYGVTFWARQPEAPAAQAYYFIYSDSTIEGFVHYPTAEWAQYDVTANLNRQKILVAFQLWGYSGGGPNPDSTYIDDVSIFHEMDLEIISIIIGPRDTFYMGDTISPAILVKNNSSFVESFWVWCRIEHTCSSDVYRDSSYVEGLGVGAMATVEFAPWSPRYLGQYRGKFSFEPNDTNPWHYFWVVERSGVKENGRFLLSSNSVQVRPSIGKSFEFVCELKLPDALKIYNSTGKLIWSKRITSEKPFKIKWYGKDHSGRSLSPGVYIVRMGEVTKRIILTN
jgi:hypothetical protein